MKINRRPQDLKNRLNNQAGCHLDYPLFFENTNSIYTMYHKQILIQAFALVIGIQAMPQVGIGTTKPMATLDVNGTIKVGAVSNGTPAKGTIRWNDTKNDFEGFNGSDWLSLTGSQGSWGNKQQFVHETNASTAMLQFNSQGTDVGHYLGNSLTMINHYLVAGAPGDFNMAGTIQNAGTLRIMKKQNGQWSNFTTLWPPEATAMSGGFGTSVNSISSHFIVGARTATVGANFGQGKAYIYAMNLNGDIALQAQLTAPDGTSSDYLGQSVAMTSMHAIAGAPGDNVGGQLSRGSAYIFQRNTMTNTWAYQAKLEPPDGLEEDVFGNAVAISGTVAAIGAPFAKVGNMHRAGKVYIFRLINNTWTYSQTITPSDQLAFDKFGTALQFVGDTLVIGAPQYNGIQLSNNGKVYFYLNTNGTMQWQHTLLADDGKKADGFGQSVHLYNGQLIVGAANANVLANELQGKAYIFRRSGSGWQLQATLKSSNGAMNDGFGQAVVLGPTGAAVSSIQADYKGFNMHGRIYFYEE